MVDQIGLHQQELKEKSDSLSSKNDMPTRKPCPAPERKQQRKSNPIDLDTCETWQPLEEDLDTGGKRKEEEKKKKTESSKSWFERVFSCTGPVLHEDDNTFEYLSTENAESIDFESLWSTDLGELEDDWRDEREPSNLYSEDNINSEKREEEETLSSLLEKSLYPDKDEDTTQFSKYLGSSVTSADGDDDDEKEESFDSLSECSTFYGVEEEEGFFESLF